MNLINTPKIIWSCHVYNYDPMIILRVVFKTGMYVKLRKKIWYVCIDLGMKVKCVQVPLQVYILPYIFAYLCITYGVNL